MPKHINKTKQLLVKQNILKGYSYKQAMINAGYKATTASKSTANEVVKVSQQEIMDDLKPKVTEEYVIKKLLNEAENAKNSGDRIKAIELLGKFLSMFTDKQRIDTTIFTKDEQSILDKYINGNRLQ